MTWPYAARVAYKGALRFGREHQEESLCGRTLAWGVLYKKGTGRQEGQREGSMR